MRSPQVLWPTKLVEGNFLLWRNNFFRVETLAVLETAAEAVQFLLVYKLVSKTFLVFQLDCDFNRWSTCWSHHINLCINNTCRKGIMTEIDNILHCYLPFVQQVTFENMHRHNGSSPYSPESSSCSSNSPAAELPRYALNYSNSNSPPESIQLSANLV